MCIKIDTNIRVEYDGKYPKACSGNLRIIENGIIIFETEKHSFHATGPAFITEDFKEVIRRGTLGWKHINEYNRFLNFVNNHPYKEYILAKVKLVIKSVKVCCGGCI